MRQSVQRSVATSAKWQRTLNALLWLAVSNPRTSCVSEVLWTSSMEAILVSPWANVDLDDAQRVRNISKVFVPAWKHAEWVHGRPDQTKCPLHPWKHTQWAHGGREQTQCTSRDPVRAWKDKVRMLACKHYRLESILCGHGHDFNCKVVGVNVHCAPAHML